MNHTLLQNLILIASLTVTNLAAAQVPPGGRTPAAPSGSGGSGISFGRPPTDPRPSVEAVEAQFREVDIETLKQPPLRAFKIEMGESQKVKLFRADPKLFDNKFVAKLVLAPHDPSQSPNLRTPDPRHDAKCPEDMLSRISLDEFGFVHRSNQSMSHAMKDLVECCPVDQRPDSQLIEYLTSAEFDRDVKWTFSNTLTYSIYAPTVKEAEARVAAIVRLHDCGICRPLQQYFYAQGQRNLGKARSGCDQFDKLTEEVQAEEGKIATPSEVSSDILTQLKAQKIMVAVELAGLNARVKACDSMLSDPKKLEASAIQSISDMKVKAEIERIGTKEKLDHIVSFIADGDKREAVNINILKLNNRRANVQREVTAMSATAGMDANLVTFYSPRRIEGDKILIFPVEWTQ